MRRPGGRRPPLPLLVPSVVAVLLLVLPLAGLLVRTPWSRLGSLLTRPDVLEALRLSVTVASCATVLSAVLGVPLAWMLARVAFPGRSLLRGVVTVPLVLPPVILGIALLLAFGRNGIVGRHLERWLGVTLPFTTAGVVLAVTVVSMPFLVVAVEGALRSQDSRAEAVASTLGASDWYAFRRITLPAVLPGVAAGAVLSFARALGEFGATITFAGSFPGTTRTLPVFAYTLLNAGDTEAAVAVSLVLLVVSVGALVGLRGHWSTR